MARRVLGRYSCSAEHSCAGDAVAIYLAVGHSAAQCRDSQDRGLGHGQMRFTGGKLGAAW
jgi:hypothetical protein